MTVKSRSWLKDEADSHVLSPVGAAELQGLRHTVLGSPGSCCTRPLSPPVVLSINFCLSPLSLSLLSVALEKSKQMLLQSRQLSSSEALGPVGCQSRFVLRLGRQVHVLPGAPGSLVVGQMEGIYFHVCNVSLKDSDGTNLMGEQTL